MSVIIKQDKDKPVPIEVLAASIVEISAGIKKLRAGPINNRGLIMLIKNAVGTSSATGYKPLAACTIEAILDGIEDLEKVYLKPRDKK